MTPFRSSKLFGRALPIGGRTLRCVAAWVRFTSFQLWNCGLRPWLQLLESPPATRYRWRQHRQRFNDVQCKSRKTHRVNSGKPEIHSLFALLPDRDNSYGARDAPGPLTSTYDRSCLTKSFVLFTSHMGDNLLYNLYNVHQCTLWLCTLFHNNVHNKSL